MKSDFFLYFEVVVTVLACHISFSLVCKATTWH